MGAKMARNLNNPEKALTTPDKYYATVERWNKSKIPRVRKKLVTDVEDAYNGSRGGSPDSLLLPRL